MKVIVAGSREFTESPLQGTHPRGTALRRCPPLMTALPGGWHPWAAYEPPTTSEYTSWHMGLHTSILRSQPGHSAACARHTPCIPPHQRRTLPAHTGTCACCVSRSGSIKTDTTPPARRACALPVTTPLGPRSGTPRHGGDTDVHHSPVSPDRRVS